jgi:hypothetical protein
LFSNNLVMSHNLHTLFQRYMEAMSRKDEYYYLEFDSKIVIFDTKEYW